MLSISNQAVLSDHHSTSYLENKEEDIREDDAIDVISGRVSGEKLSTWLSKVERRQSRGIPTTIMEYTAILYSLKILEQQQPDTSELSFRIKNCRAAGFKDITSNDPEDNNEKNWRLSKKVLRKASRDEILFHQALYHTETLGFWGSLQLISTNYITRKTDVFFVLVLIVAWFIPPAFTILVGLIIGYIFASLIEFLGHRYIAHASREARINFKVFGNIGQQMMHFFTEHSVHHGSVHQNYTEIFAPSDTNKENAYKERDIRQKQVEKAVLKKGGDALLHAMRKSDFGLTTSNHLRTVLTCIPISTLLTYLSHLAAQAVGLQPGGLFDVSVFVMSQIWILNSTQYHRYLHMTREDALKKASPLMRAYLKFRLTSFVARSHRMHHAYNGRVNQNMTPFTDFFAGWRPISISDLADLRDRKTFY